MVTVVHDLDQHTIGAILESGNGGIDDRQIWTQILGSVRKMIIRNELQRCRYERRRKNQIEVCAVGLFLVHLYVDEALAGKCGTRYERGPHYSHPELCEKDHSSLLVLALFLCVARIYPDANSFFVIGH